MKKGDYLVSYKTETKWGSFMATVLKPSIKATDFHRDAIDTAKEKAGEAQAVIIAVSRLTS